jgi:hypothetical protein
MASGATRGAPSGGVGPYRTDYDLGNDPNWLKNFAQTGQGLDQQAHDVGAQGAGFGQSLGSQALQEKNDLGETAGWASSRYAPQTQYDPSLAKAQASNQQGGAAQYGLAQQLSGMAAAPEGPSAAQAQLQQGTDAALAASVAAARSGTGFGESANAMEAAGQQSAATIGNAAAQSAQLRAQEDQAYKNRQLQALGMSGEQLGAGRQGDVGLAQQLAQQGQFGTSAALQQTGMNDQFAGTLYGQQIQAGQLAQQGYQMGQTAQENALSSQRQGQEQQLAAAQAQQQGTMGYQSDLNDIYQTDMTHNIESRKLDQQKDKDRVNGVASAIGSVAGAFLSDRRAKRRIRDADLDQVFRDLGGDDV